MKLRIESKLLKSGNTQVKFHINEDSSDHYYGYLLVNPGQTVRDVVNVIKRKFEYLPSKDLLLHSHLFSLKGKITNHPIYFYKY